MAYMSRTVQMAVATADRGALAPATAACSFLVALLLSVRRGGALVSVLYTPVVTRSDWCCNRFGCRTKLLLYHAAGCCLLPLSCSSRPLPSSMRWSMDQSSWRWTLTGGCAATAAQLHCAACHTMKLLSGVCSAEE